MKLSRILFSVLLSLFTISMFSPARSHARESPIQSEQRELSLKAGEVLRLSSSSPFRAFAVRDVDGIRVRTSSESGWSDWRELHYEEDPERGWSELMFVAPSSALELRSQSSLQTQVSLLHIEADANRYANLDPRALLTQKLNTDFRIISRAEWGADEGLGTYTPDDTPASGKDPVDTCKPLQDRYPGQYEVGRRVDYQDDLSQNLIWPREYSKQIKKIIIHHTAQDLRDMNDDGIMNGTDYRLALQAIYTFHTISRGWGDIGYHYLVDPLGNVYQGRAGDDKVIGGHVLCQNSNTIGISVMGNFQKDLVPKRAFLALTELVKSLVQRYQINPKGESQFRGAIIPNISTHTEIGEATAAVIGRGRTACPGQHLVEMMSRLRTAVVSQVNEESTVDYAYKLIDIPTNEVLKPLTTTRLPIQLNNRGTTSWNTLRLETQTGETLAETRNISIAKNGYYTFELPLTTGLTAGRNRLRLSLFANTHSEALGTFTLSYSVERPIYGFQLVSFTGQNDAILIGEQKHLQLTLENTSNFPWLPNGEAPFRLQEITRRGTRTIIDRNGQSFSLTAPVQPGEQASFQIPLARQTRQFTLSKEYLPIVGSARGLKGPQLNLNIPIEAPRFASEIKPVDTRLRLHRGTTKTIDLQLTNHSNFDWEPGMVWYSTSSRRSDRSFIQQPVKRGESYLFSATLAAGYSDRSVHFVGSIGVESLPKGIEFRRFRKKSTRFEEHFVASGRPQLIFEMVEQSSSFILPELGTHEYWVDFFNDGNVPWYRAGPEAVHLVPKNNSRLVDRTWEDRKLAGKLEQAIVQPGEIGRFLLNLDLKRLPNIGFDEVFVPEIAGQRIQLKRGPAQFRVPGRREEPPENEPRVQVQAQQQAKITALSSQTRATDQVHTPSMGFGHGETAAKHSELPPVRVWLSTFHLSEAQITSPQNFLVDGREVAGGTIWTVSQADLQSGGVVRLSAKNADYLQLHNWDRLQQFGSSSYNDNRFRGTLELRLDDGQLIAINELPLADYMKGIAEVPETNDQPQEKRKTIAVLARSYALHYLISGYEKFPGKPYNAADSPAIFQKYLGYSFEQRAPKWQEALQQTSAEVVMAAFPTPNHLSPRQGSGQAGEPPLTASERVVRAAYFSCTDPTPSGSEVRTKSWNEVWPGNDYFQRFGSVFQSVPDPLGDDPTREGSLACGHQVGLSGYGATQMARQGKGYREIIKHYYQGIDILRY